MDIYGRNNLNVMMFKPQILKLSMHVAKQFLRNMYRAWAWLITAWAWLITSVR